MKRIAGVPHELVPLEAGTVVVEVVEDPRAQGRWLLNVAPQVHDEDAAEPAGFLLTLGEAERLAYVLRRVVARAAVALHNRSAAGRGANVH